MNRKFDEQQRRLDEQDLKLKSLNKEQFLDHISELIQRSSQRHGYNQARQERNARVHDANIERSLEALDWVQFHDNDKLSAATEGFEETYGLTFKKSKFLVRIAPKEIIEFVNQKSDLSFLGCYRLSQQSTEKIDEMKEICTAIIDLREESHRRHTAYPNDKIKAKRSEYEQLHNCWKAAESGAQETQGMIE
jgi:hypothetical protein